MKKIDIEPFYENIKVRLLAEINTQTAEGISSSTEYLNDFKTRAINLADGIASEQLSYAFVVRRFKEEEINLRDHVLAVGSIGAAHAETFAKDVVTEFKTFLEEQITPETNA